MLCTGKIANEIGCIFVEGAVFEISIVKWLEYILNRWRMFYFDIIGLRVESLKGLFQK